MIMPFAPPLHFFSFLLDLLASEVTLMKLCKCVSKFSILTRVGFFLGTS
jgi:hypothetical protein